MGLKILFVYPLPRPGPTVYPGYHHGLGYLSSVLKHHGHTTSLYAAHTCDKDALGKVLARESPDVVGITATTAEFPLAGALAGTILDLKQLPVFFGGVHATVAPEEVQSIKGIRGLCRGEGEQGFARVVDSLAQGREDTEVPGFWFQDKGQWIKNPPGQPTALEDLPFPDRELFGYAAWVRPVKKIIGAEFLGSRGCPFHCTYCCTPLYSDLYKPHPYWRRRPVEDLISEVKTVLNRYPVDTVGFHDDIFTLDAAWLEAFCRRYAEEIGMPFWCNSRVGCITEKQAGMLRKAGCIRVHVAVETGNPGLRREILNRNISDEEILETFSFLKKAGLKRLAFNMLGLPGETEETLLQTVAMNRRIRPERLHVTLFQPFPGTALYRLCKEKGLLMSGMIGNYYDEGTLVKNPRLPPEVLYRYLRDFVSLVYA